MKAWAKTKFIMGVAGLASVAVIASVSFERSLYSDAFMVDYTAKVESKRLDDSFARLVASEVKKEKIAVKYLELNAENSEKINGRWEVMRGFEDISDKVSEFYNKYTQSKSRSVFIEAELAVGGVWIRGEEFENFFYVSDLTDAGTLSVVRKLGESHYEVLELKKSIVVQTVASVERQPAPPAVQDEARDYKKGVSLDKDLELVIERALVPDLAKDVIMGEMVSGYLSLVSGNIESLSATVRGEDGKEKSIDFTYAEIKDGGQFQVDYMGEIIHGIITNNGTDAYRVRFATGPLQGAMLNYMSYEQLEIMQEREEEARYKAEEEALLKEETAAETKEVKEDVQEMQMESGLSNHGGFKFGSDRAPASIK